MRVSRVVNQGETGSKGIYQALLEPLGAAPPPEAASAAPHPATPTDHSAQPRRKHERVWGLWV